MESKLGLLAPVLLVLRLVEAPEVMIRKRCTAAGVEVCIEPVKNMTTLVQVLFPPLTMDQYRNLCATFKKVEQCLETMFLDYCPEPAIKAKKDTVTLLEFMCFSQEDQYDDFGQKDCFDKILLQAEIMLCTQRYMGVPEAMKAKHNPTPEEGASFCSLTHDVLYCRYLVVEDHCGKDAATWQHLAHTASLAYVLDKFKCKVDLDTNFSVERTNLGYLMVIFIAIMLLCAIPARIFICPNNAKIKEAQLQEKRQGIARSIANSA